MKSPELERHLAELEATRRRELPRILRERRRQEDALWARELAAKAGAVETERERRQRYYLANRDRILRDTRARRARAQTEKSK